MDRLEPAASLSAAHDISHVLGHEASSHVNSTEESHYAYDLLALQASGGAGAVYSVIRTGARLPQLALELGALSLVSGVVLDSLENKSKGALGSLAQLAGFGKSDDNATQKWEKAGTVALTYSAVAFAGSLMGATLMRTAAVAGKEDSFLSNLRQFHPESAEHSIRVGKYSELVAKELDLPWWQQRAAQHAGKMHDIGKLNVPIEILAKPGRLDPEETAIMRLHPLHSKQALGEIPYAGALKDVPEDASVHHEWMNGLGYPHGLKGDQLSTVGKIVPPADVFDAVTAGRKYASADRKFGERMPLTKVKQIIDSETGTHFDPQSVRALWSVPAEKMISVLESGPRRPQLSASSLLQFKGTTFGRLLDVMSDASATEKETALADELNRIYRAADVDVG